MEKSFASLGGIGGDVVSIITSLGASYAPTNTEIQIANFTARITDLKQLNADIAVLLKTYGDAVRYRKDAFESTDGMKDRITNIKDYLAGFPGGKSNQLYISFNQAIQGV